MLADKKPIIDADLSAAIAPLATVVYVGANFAAISHSHSADNITSGALAKARQHAQTAYKDEANTWAEAPIFHKPILLRDEVGTFTTLKISERNILLGRASGIPSTGINVVVIGHDALLAPVYVTDSVYVGHQAGSATVEGNGNTAIGKLSVATATTASGNTGCGDSTLRYSTGGHNTAAGYVAGQGNKTGEYNVYLGAFCGTYGAGTGSFNFFAGQYAGAASDVDLVTAIGSNNVGIGRRAMRFSTCDHGIAIGEDSCPSVSGDHVVALGNRSAFRVTSGSTSLFLGSESGASVAQKVDVTNSVALGHNSYTTIDNQVVLGNDAITETVVHGSIRLGRPGPRIGLSGGILYFLDASENYQAVNTGNLQISNGSQALALQVADRGGMNLSGEFFWGSALTGNNRGTLSWDTNKAIISAPVNLDVGCGGVARYIANTHEFSALVKLNDYTAATLPSAATYPGHECNVTDSSVTSFGSTVAGGGSNSVKVRSNGTNWTVTGI